MAKRLVILIALILFCFSSTHAQLLKGYGVKTGVVVANQDFDYTDGFDFDTKNRTGFDIGIYVEWFNLPFFSVLTEAHYVQKGMINEVARTNEFGEQISPLKFDNRVDYLSFTIFVKRRLLNWFVSPYLSIGPQFDFLLGYNSENMKTVYEEFDKMDMGGAVAIGFEIKTKPVIMLLELRDSFGFTDAYKTDLLKVKNNSFEILFGLRL